MREEERSTGQGGVHLGHRRSGDLGEQEQDGFNLIVTKCISEICAIILQ